MRSMVGWLLVACLCVLPWTAEAAGVRINDPVTIVGPLNYGVDAGGDDTYACALSPALGGAAYVAGACYQCQVATGNTGPATINFDGIGAVAITKVTGGVTTPLADNDIRAGHLLHVCFDGTQMQCQNCDGNVSSAAAPGFLPDGTAGSLACGAGTGGQAQLGPGSYVEYCGYEATPLLHVAGLPQGITWGDTSGCSGDENLGKLTVIAGVIQCSPDVADAATTAWNDGAATNLTCGGGAQGQHQVMDTGRLQYCGGEDVSVLYHGYVLPSPLSFNINPATCTGDGEGGKLTVNGSNQVVCATDSVGEGGGGPGDITTVGNIASGDAGTTGFPLTNLWYLESAAPASPASTQGLLWLDATSKNFSVKTSDGVVKHMIQTAEPVTNQVVTGWAADGAPSMAQLSSANLSDGSTLAKLAETQILTNKQVVPRVVTLSAASGTVTAPNADLYDVFERHDISGTLTIPAPTTSGLNPRPQQPITFSLYAASAQSVVWDAAYATGYGVALPTTLPAGQYVAVGMRWNVLSGKWETWGNTGDSIATVAEGGTGVATLTGLVIGNGTSAFTAATSSTVGQVLRVTGANTYALGAVDLADTDAVTGTLANARTTGASTNTVSTLVLRDGSGNFAAGTITAALTGTASLATALAANGGNCSAGQFPLGVDTLGAVETCTALPTTITGTANQITASAATGAITLSIPTSPTLPGTTTGTFSGNLTGTASLATALAANPTACPGGQFVTDMDANGTLTCGTPAGGGTGTIHLSAGGYSLPAANPAQLDASENNLRLLFDATTSECALWQGRMNADYVSGLAFRAQFSMTSATSGTFNLDVSVMAVTPGDAADINTDSYDTVNACDDAGVPGTAGYLDEISCTLTNADSIAAGDFFKVKICRDVGDTATGDAEVVHAVLLYTR